jgi:hypothetical protein
MVSSSVIRITPSGSCQRPDSASGRVDTEREPRARRAEVYREPLRPQGIDDAVRAAPVAHVAMECGRGRWRLAVPPDGEEAERGGEQGAYQPPSTDRSSVMSPASTRY